MTRSDLRQAVFGADDGLTSTLCVVVAAVITASQTATVATGFTIAFGSALSMGWSEWLGDETGSLHAALVMAAATAIASAIPIIPFVFLWKTSGVIGCAVLSVLILVLIAEMRMRLTGAHRGRAWLITIGGTVIVAAVGAVVGLIA